MPKLDLTGALAEIWFQINYAAYHMAYVRVYSQSAALRTQGIKLGPETSDARQCANRCCHLPHSLSCIFLVFEHVFEALRTAITRGQKQHPDLKYFWSYERRLDDIEKFPIRQEIKDYRNIGHQNPAIIGCRWDHEGHFLHHLLPTISGHQPKEDIDLNTQLQQYFEFATNVWLEFAPGDFKEKFPRDFRFPVSVPYLYEGELPKERSAVFLNWKSRFNRTTAHCLQPRTRPATAHFINEVKPGKKPRQVKMKVAIHRYSDSAAFFRATSLPYASESAGRASRHLAVGACGHSPCRSRFIS